MGLNISVTLSYDMRLPDLNKPLISVLIPFYNREKLLPRAIESVLSQTYTRWNIVLVDDGSTDGSAHVANRFCEISPSKIFLIQQQERCGAGAARNTGIKYIKSDFIALLDSDDEWYPNFLEVIMDAFNYYPDIDWVYCNTERVDSDGKVIRPSTFDDEAGIDFRRLKIKTINKLNIIDDHNILYTAITSTIKAGANSVIRRKVFDNISYNHNIHIGSDRLVNIEAISNGVLFGYINEVMVTVHQHGDNVSIVSDEDVRLQKESEINCNLIRVYEQVKKNIDLNRREKKGIKKRLSGLYFWFGYERIINGKNFFYGLNYLTKGILYNPMNLYFWKSAVACITKRIVSMVFSASFISAQK